MGKDENIPNTCEKQAARAIKAARTNGGLIAASGLPAYGKDSTGNKFYSWVFP
jgi:hypothetical protein